MTIQSGKARGSPGIASGPVALVIGQGEPTVRLNLKYLFDTFVIGAPTDSPTRARWPWRPRRPTPPAGSRASARRLLHAIGHYARSLYPGTRVQYVSSEKFTNEFINSIRDSKDDSFRKPYREMDILLVDDIQFLADKESMQEEFSAPSTRSTTPTSRVTAFASLNRQPVDPGLTEIVLKDLTPRATTPRGRTSTAIMGTTADYFGLTIDDLCGSWRGRQLVTARQIAMHLCRELTDLSLPKIGALCGCRDHTTVMHADRKIRNLMAERHSIYNTGHRADQPHQERRIGGPPRPRLCRRLDRRVHPQHHGPAPESYVEPRSRTAPSARTRSTTPRTMSFLKPMPDFIVEKVEAVIRKTFTRLASA